MLMALAGGVGCECRHLLRQDRNQLQGAVAVSLLFCKDKTNTLDVYLLVAQCFSVLAIQWLPFQGQASSFTLVWHDEL